MKTILALAMVCAAVGTHTPSARAAAPSTAAPTPPSPGGRARAGGSAVPTLTLLEPDTVVTVGKPITIHAQLVDPGKSVAFVRFTFNGRAGAEIARDSSQAEVDFSEIMTPAQAGRVAVLVEALDLSEETLVRDAFWLKASSAYSESVQVHASPLWGDLIPKESLLHQHPVVTVHSFTPRSTNSDEDRFGPNQRPVHVIFLVDGKGFGEKLPQLLDTLAAFGAPAENILRERDEIGLLVVGDAPEVRRDFHDGSLQKAVQGLATAGGTGAGSIDMGLLLRSLVSASPASASTVGVIVTNGVHWGTLWRRKALAGSDRADYLLTLDDLQQIRTQAWEKDIAFSTIAVSTPEFPLEMDAKGRLSFEPLERSVSEALAKDASGAGKESAARAATFNVYIHQMFDLLATLSAATGAERGVRLSQATPASLRASVHAVLEPIVGRFQRRDFEVFEAAPGAKCTAEGQGQILEGASPRFRDKLMLGIAVDRSGSTNLMGAAHEVQAALRAIVKTLRPQDCMLLYSFSALDAERVSKCVDSEKMVDEASGQIVSGAERSQGTDIFGSAFSIANNLVALEVYASGKEHPLESEQELEKAIIIITDGWQTRDTMDVQAAVSFLKKHRIRVFEVLIEGEPVGRQVSGWSVETGGSRLPPDGVPIPVGKTDAVVSQLIGSVYWGMRDAYRIDYTSSSPEKEWRDVCVRIKDRPDLYVYREGGRGYRADKSAYAHLFRMIEDRSLALPARRQALDVVSDLGTEFEFRRVVSVTEDEQVALRAPALVGALRMSRRLRLPSEKLEKIYANMDVATRQQVVKTMADAPDSYDPDVLEGLLAAELRRPSDRTTEEMRWEALVALGRIPAHLSDSTLQALGAFALSPQTSPSLREVASKLLEASAARVTPGHG